MERKEYETAELEVIHMENDNIIITSIGDGNSNTDDTGFAPASHNIFP